MKKTKMACDVCGTTKFPLWRYCKKEGGKLFTKCRKHLDTKAPT